MKILTHTCEFYRDGGSYSVLVQLKNIEVMLFLEIDCLASTSQELWHESLCMYSDLPLQRKNSREIGRIKNKDINLFKGYSEVRLNYNEHLIFFKELSEAFALDSSNQRLGEMIFYLVRLIKKKKATTVLNP